MVTLGATHSPTHAHNVGVSLLSRLGISGLIANSTEEYIQLGINLGRNPERFIDLRSSLRRTMQVSTLCDGPGFTKGLEDVYQRMWRKYSNL